MTNTNTNGSPFVKSVISLLDAKDKSDTGAFSLINDHAASIDDLAARISNARDDDDKSIRGIILEAFGSTPEGEKIMNRYATLVELKSGVSSDQRAEKQAIKRRLNNVNVMLSRTVDCYNLISELNATGFVVIYRKIANTGATACKVRGVNDDDYATFSVTQLLRLATHDISVCLSYTDLQELCKTKKAGTANTQPSGAVEAVPASLMSKAVDALDTGVAGFDISKGKDNGLSPVAMSKLALLWARLDADLPQELKDKARMQFDAEGASASDVDTVAA